MNLPTVYVLLDCVSGLLKVGQSRNFTARIRAIKNALDDGTNESRKRLEILLLVPGDRDLERAVLRAARPNQIGPTGVQFYGLSAVSVREWFDPAAWPAILETSMRGY